MKRLKIVFHDLKAEINSQIKSELGSPDMILHLAAASHVDRSIIYPMEFVLDNVVGTVNLLDFARSLKNLEIVGLEIPVALANPSIFLIFVFTIVLFNLLTLLT